MSLMQRYIFFCSIPKKVCRNIITLVPGSLLTADMCDILTYFSGMSAGFFFLTSLICGLQLCFNIFGAKKCENKILSHFVGTVMLLMSFTTIFYIIYDTFCPNLALLIIGNTFDYIIFCVIAVAAYVLYANNHPTIRTSVVLSLPFVILAIVNISVPDTRKYLLDVAVFTLILQYVYFAILLRNYENSLNDLYSDPKSHSISWIRGVIALFIGWWAVRTIFRMSSINIWYDTAMYTYLVFFIFFVFIKINNLGESVSLEARKQIEQVEWGEISTLTDLSTPMKKELMRLLEEEQIYLNPNLTVIDVVRELGTNTKYFSAMLHNDMHTSFSTLINEYRIAKAKELLQLTNDKIENVGISCGFNSRQSFCRTFSKITGKKPTEFRNGYVRRY